jgi:hypothetical protein
MTEGAAAGSRGRTGTDPDETAAAERDPDETAAAERDPDETAAGPAGQKLRERCTRLRIEHTLCSFHRRGIRRRPWL